jgi:hypothetical protein
MSSRLNTVSLALQIPTMAIAVGLPIWRIVTKGLFWSSFLRMWLYLILWAMLFSMVIPPILGWVFHDRSAYNDFPDTPAVTGMILGAWLDCMIVCAMTWVIRSFWIWFRSRRR